MFGVTFGSQRQFNFKLIDEPESLYEYNMNYTRNRSFIFLIGRETGLCAIIVLQLEPPIQVRPFINIHTKAK